MSEFQEGGFQSPYSRTCLGLKKKTLVPRSSVRKDLHINGGILQNRKWLGAGYPKVNQATTDISTISNLWASTIENGLCWGAFQVKISCFSLPWSPRVSCYNNVHLTLPLMFPFCFYSEWNLVLNSLFYRCWFQLSILIVVPEAHSNLGISINFYHPTSLANYN